MALTADVDFTVGVAFLRRAQLTQVRSRFPPQSIASNTLSVIGADGVLTFHRVPRAELETGPIQAEDLCQPIHRTLVEVGLTPRLDVEPLGRAGMTYTILGITL